MTMTRAIFMAEELIRNLEIDTERIAFALVFQCYSRGVTGGKIYQRLVQRYFVLIRPLNQQNNSPKLAL